VPLQSARRQAQAVKPTISIEQKAARAVFSAPPHTKYSFLDIA